MKMSETNKAVLLVASLASFLVSALGAQAPTAARSSVATPRVGSSDGKSGWQAGGFGKTSDWGAGKGSFGSKPQTSGIWREDTVPGRVPPSSSMVHEAVRSRVAPVVLPPFQVHPPGAAASARASMHGGSNSSLGPRHSVLKSSRRSASVFTKTHEKGKNSKPEPGLGVKPIRPSTSFGPKPETPGQDTLDTGSIIKKLNSTPQ